MPPKLPDNVPLAAAPIWARSLGLPPALVGLVLQFAAFLLTAFLLAVLRWNPGILTFALVQAGLATLLAQLARLPRWWLAIEFAFAPAVVGALALHLAPVWYLLAFALLLLVYWSVMSSRVPLFLSSDAAHAALVPLLPADRPFAMIDLGSGLGGVIANLAQVRNKGTFHGVEAAPLPFLISKLRLLRTPNCSVRWGSFWQEDLGRYDVVYAYLSPEPMSRLWQKVRREMKPGALFISNSFAVPGVEPARSIPLNDLGGSVLHVWRI